MNSTAVRRAQTAKRRALIVEVSQAILFWIVAMPIAYLFNVINLSF